MVAAVVPSPVVRQSRAESPERWRKALERAIENGLEVFTVADTGERFVTSASKLDVLHRTDGHTCTCEAALAGDPICQHRAAVRFCLGWVMMPDPEPAKCPCCRGGRVERWLGHDIVGDALCDVCHGTGIRPATIRPVAAAA